MAATTSTISGDYLEDCAAVMRSNANTISRFGGRLAVLYKFVDAALPQLSTSQRAKVAMRFREGVEDMMFITDDIALPAEYHEALLKQTNVLLTALEQGTAPPR